MFFLMRNSFSDEFGRDWLPSCCQAKKSQENSSSTFYTLDSETVRTIDLELHTFSLKSDSQV